MKKLTIGAFAWAITGAVLLAALSQAGERVMRPEFGAGLKATPAKKAPAVVSPTSPTPTTGPGGEEIFTDETKGTHEDDPTTDKESGWARFGNWILGKEPSADDDPWPATDEDPWPTTDDDPWPTTDDDPWPATDDDPWPATDDEETTPTGDTRLKGKKILEN